jgi:hypothetical protein
MNPNDFTKILNLSERLWDGKFPSIATSGDSGEPPPRPATAKYDEELWAVGWTDGATGQPPHHGIALIKAHDDNRNRRVAQQLSHRKALAEAEADASLKRIERSANDLDRTRAELIDLEERRRRDPHEFSVFTGILYVVIALILLLSDMPLSLSLVAEGFNLPLKYDLDSGETIVLGQVFSPQWREVLRYLWQPIILAVGIACLGIFFKIVTDYFLSSTEERPSDPWFAIAFKWMRRAFFALAFALMLGGLWSVGTLRSRQQALNAAVERRPDTQPRMRVAEDPTTSDEKLKQQRIDKAKYDQEELFRSDAVDVWTSRSFIALAITLPLIGGICFSVGAKRVQRVLQLWTARVRCMWRGLRIDRDRKNQAVQKSSSEFLAQELQRLSSHGDEIDVTALRVYLHGYSRGYAMPQKLEPNRNLYDHCKAILQRWIATGVQDMAADHSRRFRKDRQ